MPITPSKDGTISQAKAISKRAQEWTNFPRTIERKHQCGMGYQPMKDEIIKVKHKEEAKEATTRGWHKRPCTLRSYALALHGQFV